MVTRHDLYKNIEDVDIYTESKILKVKVSIIFRGTIGSSRRRKERRSLPTSRETHRAETTSTNQASQVFPREPIKL